MARTATPTPEQAKLGEEPNFGHVRVRPERVTAYRI
jgi:hypothetical protein